MVTSQGSGTRLPVWAYAAIDAVLVLLFAGVGRTSHDEGAAASGVIAVAWPFLVGAACGWALVRWRSRHWPLTWHHAIPVVLCAVLVGMLLRVIIGAGTALSFILVATCVLALLLLGWRALAARLLA